MAREPDERGPYRGDVLEVTIEKVVFGGEGLARVGLEGRFVLFVPFTAEGDRVSVRVTERKAQHGRAEVVELIAPSAARERPPCPYFQNCGGCQYQHLKYPEELRMKEAQVVEAFRRVGKLTDIPLRPIIASPQNYGYRNRITVHAANGRIGFHNLNGRELVDISRCEIAQPGVNEELTRLRASNPPDGHYSLRDVGVPPSGFFQANSGLLDPLRETVAAALPEAGDLLLEAYCGGGFFTESIAKRFQRIKAMDNDPRTLRDAQRLNLPQVEWQLGDVASDFAEELLKSNQAEATVLVDPPREGLPDTVVNALIFQPVPHLVYVSCDPATLARDARLLARAYTLKWIQPLDLFPRTAQVETVTCWERRSLPVQ